MSRPVLLARDLGGLAEWYAAQPLRPRFDPDNRWYERLDLAGDHEAWLLSWLPGQSTDLHDHGPASGAFTVVSGVLTERVARGARDVLHTLTTGQSRVFAPNYVHQVSNNGPDPAVTVHVYSAARTMHT